MRDQRWRPEMRRRPDVRDQRWRPEMRGHPEIRWRPDMTESRTTARGGGSLPSFVLTAFLYIERSCALIIL